MEGYENFFHKNGEPILQSERGDIKVEKNKEPKSSESNPDETKKNEDAVDWDNKYE